MFAPQAMAYGSSRGSPNRRKSLHNFQRNCRSVAYGVCEGNIRTAAEKQCGRDANMALVSSKSCKGSAGARSIPGQGLLLLILCLYLSSELVGILFRELSWIIVYVCDDMGTYVVIYCQR